MPPAAPIQIFLCNVARITQGFRSPQVEQLKGVAELQNCAKTKTPSELQASCTIGGRNLSTISSFCIASPCAMHIQYTHTHIYIYIDIHIHTYIYIYIYIYTYIHIYIHTHIYLYIYIYRQCMYKCIMYKHTHTHTCLHRNAAEVLLQFLWPKDAWCKGCQKGGNHFGVSY